MPTSTDGAGADRSAAWSLSDIELLDRDGFVERLGFLFEGSPWIAAEGWSSRPWGSRAALHRALLDVVARADGDRQLALIQAHPDLVGRAARTGSLTAASTAEQRAAGLDPDALTPDEIRRFETANAAYRERFGFPFVICAREHRKDTILAGFATRLDHDRESEISTALAEIGRIAWHRLTDVVADDDQVSGVDAVSDQYEYEISYGKQAVPVYRVFATPLTGIAPIPESPFTGRVNNLLACEIGVEVLGDDFLPAYTQGDNSMIVATDSMKNFIIRESLAYSGATLEGLLHFLGAGFAMTYAQMHTLTMTARELPFTAAVVPYEQGFQASGNLFSHGRGDHGRVSLSLDRQCDDVRITGHACGIADMQLMKLTGSAFTRFVRDDYTTLPERGDRPLYIHMDMSWQYRDTADMLDPARGRYVPLDQMRDLLAVTFETFVSESIQHLLHEMGRRALQRFPSLASVSFEAQNRTRDPYGERADDPRVKVYSDPFPAFGQLALTMRRTG
jgi:urate oxidase/2-oxo-4-hydroxy-4-carboxy-5-ureidoimidazoline decarboxylase